MDPVSLIVMGGAAAGGAIANWMISKDAQHARQDELDQMQALAAKLQAPNFDTSMITPEDYKVLQKFSPTLAPYVQEAAPEIIKAASPGAVQGRQAEMDALSRFRGLSDTGEDLQSKILQSKALAAADKQNRGNVGAIQQRFDQRGQGGSTNELVASLLANQNGNQTAHDQAQNAALAAYNTRLQAMRDSANLGSSIRNEDVSTEGKNADILNAYNTRLANSRQTFENNRANTANTAEMYNQTLAQNTANANITQQNQAAQNYQKMVNDLKQKDFNNQADKTSLAMGGPLRQIGQINQTAQDTKDLTKGITGAVSGIAGAYAANSNNQSTPTSTAATGTGTSTDQSVETADPGADEDFAAYVKRMKEQNNNVYGQ